MRTIFLFRCLFSLTGIVGSYVINSWKHEMQKLVTEFVRFVFPSPTKLREGNVFTSVCDSVHGARGCVW